MLINSNIIAYNKAKTSHFNPLMRKIDDLHVFSIKSIVQVFTHI